MADDVFGIVGTTLAGNFRVEQVVAEGGFGVVYRALHKGFGAPVALKCLKVTEARTTRERQLFVTKFREEAQLLFRLSASIPEVVRPLHADVLQLDNGQFVPFLALEWLEGESLDKIIDRRRLNGDAPLPLHKLAKMLRPIAHAIAKAHRFPSPQGIVSIIHRDLKPENFFLTTQEGNERIKILDFGIAQAKSLAEQAVGRVTSSDKLNAFSPAYGAPEQWVPKRFGQTGPWTDVWGLALTMVEALVGRQVIDGETQAMMGTALDTNRRPTPRNEGVSISHEVDAVFQRALAVHPRDRTKDIETFWTELEAAMGLPSSFGARASTDEDPYDKAPPPSTSKPKLSGSNLWLEPSSKDAAPLHMEIDIVPNTLRSSALRQGAAPITSGLEVDLQAVDAAPGAIRRRSGSFSALSGPIAGPATSDVSPSPPSVRPKAGSLSGVAAPAPPSGRVSSPPPSVRPRMGSLPGATTPAAGPASVRPPVSSHRPPPVFTPEDRSSSPPSTLRRMLLPLLLMILAVGVAVTHFIMRRSGPGLDLGPIKWFWLSGALLVAGLGLFFWSFLGDRDD